MNRLIPFLFLSALPVLHGQPIQIQTVEFPWAIVGTGYNFAIQTAMDARCTSGDSGLALDAGRLPRGLDLRGGSLVGTPREAGTFRFSIRSTNTCSSAVKAFELVVTGQPILRVFPEALSFEAHVGQAGPARRAVHVSATWPSLPYSAQADADWLVQKEQGGVTPDRGSALSADMVSVGVDPKNLAPGVYRTAIRFFTWPPANAPVIAVTLTVLP